MPKTTKKKNWLKIVFFIVAILLVAFFVFLFIKERINYSYSSNIGDRMNSFFSNAVKSSSYDFVRSNNLKIEVVRVNIDNVNLANPNIPYLGIVDASSCNAEFEKADYPVVKSIDPIDKNYNCFVQSASWYFDTKEGSITCICFYIRE